MKLTVINVLHTVDEGFDAGPLEEFCRGHEVRGWVEHFFVDGGCPRLALVLEYEEIAGVRSSGRAVRSERDFRRELPAPSRPADERLRDWRSLRARQDGVPVYVVFNNRELAVIAGAMPVIREASPCNSALTTRRREFSKRFWRRGTGGTAWISCAMCHSGSAN
jgi:hypothetical protein